MSKINSNNVNRTLISFWIIGIISFAIRAYINFSQHLLVGNGGYYPLQVRTLLERGELAFQDMPLLFYLDAGIIKFLALFGIQITDNLILTVVQLVDSISIPLLLIPLFQILRTLNKSEFSVKTILFAAYPVLTFHTLALTSSTQKNALAITFFFFCISGFLKYFHTGRQKHLLIAIVFFILIGFTHFGTFSFTLIIGTLFLVFRYKKKALIPLVLMTGIGLTIIYLLDPVRFDRLVLAWKEFSLPRPHQIIPSIVYLSIAIIAIFQFRKHKQNINPINRPFITTLIASLILIPLPFIHPQYTDRLIGFLFIPILLLIIFFNPFASIRFRKTISVLIGILVLSSMVFFISMSPPRELNQESLADLKMMKTCIPNPENSVVVSRHNLEFWVAWSLNVNVSQESKFNDALIKEYADVFIINQIHSTGSVHTKKGGSKRTHFDEPIIPADATLVYSSNYFKLYKYHPTP